jgi:hypothetical protein
MTPKTLADLLKNREYGCEINDGESAMAAQHGLVVMYGAGDDNIEFRGAIDGEVGAYQGTRVQVDSDGIVPMLDDVRDKYSEAELLEWSARCRNGVVVHARWDCDGSAWSFIFTKNSKCLDIGAEFTVCEDGEPFSTGVVFHISELSK